jgi:hypothetical protein
MSSRTERRANERKEMRKEKQNERRNQGPAMQRKIAETKNAKHYRRNCTTAERERSATERKLMSKERRNERNSRKMHTGKRKGNINRKDTFEKRRRTKERYKRMV